MNVTEAKDVIVAAMPDLMAADIRWLLLDEKRHVEQVTGNKATMQDVYVSLGLTA